MKPTLAISLRQAGALLLIALLPAVVAATLHPRKPAWSREQMAEPEITMAQVAHWEGRVLWVDARPEAEYQRQHAPGAVWLAEERWEQQLPEFLRAWRPGLRVVVYCNDTGCALSQSVARRLRRETSIDGIFVLKGGWTAWREAQKLPN